MSVKQCMWHVRIMRRSAERWSITEASESRSISPPWHRNDSLFPMCRQAVPESLRDSLKATRNSLKIPSGDLGILIGSLSLELPAAAVLPHLRTVLDQTLTCRWEGRLTCRSRRLSSRRAEARRRVSGWTGSSTRDGREAGMFKRTTGGTNARVTSVTIARSDPTQALARSQQSDPTSGGVHLGSDADPGRGTGDGVVGARVDGVGADSCHPVSVLVTRR